MAIVNGIFSSALKGTVGNVVFRNSGTNQIVSQKPAKVKNPRTLKQQEQRCCLATVMAGYRTMQIVCSHSWQGVSEGKDSMAQFMKVNLANVRHFYNYNVKGNPHAQMNPFVISNGSLPNFEVIADSDGKKQGLWDVEGGATEPTGTTTLKQFLDTFGLQVGSQLTIVSLREDESVEYNLARYAQPGSKMKIISLVFKTDAESLTKPLLVISTDAKHATNKEYTINPEVLDNASLNATSLRIQIDPTVNRLIDWSLIIDNHYPTQVEPVGIIVSRKVGSQWEYSHCEMSMDISDIKPEDRILLEDAVQTYSPTANALLKNAKL